MDYTKLRKLLDEFFSCYKKVKNRSTLFISFCIFYTPFRSWILQGRFCPWNFRIFLNITNNKFANNSCCCILHNIQPSSEYSFSEKKRAMLVGRGAMLNPVLPRKTPQPLKSFTNFYHTDCERISRNTNLSAGNKLSRSDNLRRFACPLLQNQIRSLMQARNLFFR